MFHDAESSDESESSDSSSEGGEGGEGVRVLEWTPKGAQQALGQWEQHTNVCRACLLYAKSL